MPLDRIARRTTGASAKALSAAGGRQLSSIGTEQPILVVPVRGPAQAQADLPDLNRVREEYEKCGRYFEQVSYGKMSVDVHLTPWVTVARSPDFYFGYLNEWPLADDRFDYVLSHLRRVLYDDSRGLLVPMGRDGVSKRRWTRRRGPGGFRGVVDVPVETGIVATQNFCEVARRDGDGTLFIGAGRSLSRKAVGGRPTRVESMGTVHDMCFSGRYLYTAEGTAGIGVYDRVSLALVQHIKTESAIISVVLQGNSIHAIGKRGVFTLRINRPAPITIAQVSIAEEAHCGVLAGAFLVVGSMSGVEVFGASDPDHPSPAGVRVIFAGLARPGPITALAVIGARVIAATLNDGLFAAPLPKAGMTELRFTRFADATHLSLGVNDNRPESGIVVGMTAHGDYLVVAELGVGLRVFAYTPIPGRKNFTEVTVDRKPPFAAKSATAPVGQAREALLHAYRDYYDPASEAPTTLPGLRKWLVAEAIKRAAGWLQFTQTGMTRIEDFASVSVFADLSEGSQANNFNAHYLRDDVLGVDYEVPRKSSWTQCGLRFGTMAHECGHRLTTARERPVGIHYLVDSYYLYPAALDLMGSTSVVNAKRECAPILIGPQLWQCAFYSDDNVAEWNGQSGATFDLVEHGLEENADSRRVHLVRIPHAPGRPFFLELRGEAKDAQGREAPVLFSAGFPAPSSVPPTTSSIVVSWIAPEGLKAVCPPGGQNAQPVTVGQSLVLDESRIKVTVVSEISANPLCWRVRIDRI